MALTMNNSQGQAMMDFPLSGEVLTTFWGQLDHKDQLFNGESVTNLDLSVYMEYYRRQWHTMVTNAEGRYVTARTFKDITDIVEWMLRGDARESIISHLSHHAPQEACENSLNLAARLLLMLKIGVVKHQVVPRYCMIWNKGSLGDFVKGWFGQPQIHDAQYVRLPKSFNAWSIHAIGGLQIEFTDNLADHLLLVDDDTKVLIFHHASFLECQKMSLFPDGLIDETLRTLALLFPQSEFRASRGSRNDKRAWFRKASLDFKPCIVDPRVILCGNLRAEHRQIECFTFWRDRLVILKQVYDDARPKTISQWWHDRRNGERWYTFWVAILVLFITTTLGAIQCVASMLQVYKAYYPTTE